MRLRIFMLMSALVSLPVAAQMAPIAPPATVAAAGPVDPARLDVARRIMLRLLPDGTYKTLMGGSMQQMMGRMTEGAYNIPLRTFMDQAGLTPAQKAKIGPGTLGEIMKILDPAFQQRQKLTMDILFAEITTMLSSMEPDLREAMAGAYARKFDLGQLGEIDRFFATPTGSAYAASTMTIMADPAIAARMQSMLPMVLKAMPAIMEKSKAATAGLPARRKYEDLTPAERSQLAGLMGATLPAKPVKKVPVT